MKIIDNRYCDFNSDFDRLEIGSVFEANIGDKTYYFLKLRRINFENGICAANALRLDNMTYQLFLSTTPVRLLDASIIINGG